MNMIQYRLSDLVYPRKMAWDVILSDLNSKGVTPSQVAMLTGAVWSSLQRWRDGTEPRYSMGQSILIIHTRYCGEDLTNQRVTEAR